MAVLNSSSKSLFLLWLVGSVEYYYAAQGVNVSGVFPNSNAAPVCLRTKKPHETLRAAVVLVLCFYFI